MYDRERHVAMFAARRAALVADEYHDRDLRDDTETAMKADVTDLVTEGDHRAQRRIVDAIREHFPDDRIIAEEVLDEDDASDSDVDREWVIDPIDGTMNFSTGLPLYNTSIAFREDGKTRVGVVISPRSSLGRLWFAVEGEGAEVTDLDGNPTSISVSDHDELEGSMVCKYDHVFDDVLVNERRLGSCALTLALVAEGGFDAYAIDFPLAEWDWAAGKLIVEEAGGRFTLGEDDLLVASNGTAIHDEIARRYRE